MFNILFTRIEWGDFVMWNQKHKWLLKKKKKKWCFLMSQYYFTLSGSSLVSCTIHVWKNKIEKPAVQEKSNWQKKRMSFFQDFSANNLFLKPGKNVFLSRVLKSGKK